jgi:hypothetical protein
MQVIPEFFSAGHSVGNAEFICCKMTLEHIPDPLHFMTTLRRAIGPRRQPEIFFQIPDATRIMQEVAFWDVYYEHCNYFTPTSLANLFVSSGFEVLQLSHEFDGQYLTIEARPAAGSLDAGNGQLSRPGDDWYGLLSGFAAKVEGAVERWRRFFQGAHGASRKVVLWGGGSKAVAFLSTLRLGQEVDSVIDINPYRQGTYLPGTGHRIAAPESLREAPAAAVIVMNPVYLEEIRASLRNMGVSPRLLTVEQPPVC